MKDLDDDPILSGAHTIELYEPDDTLYQTYTTPTPRGKGKWRNNFTTLATDTEGAWLVVWTIVSGGATGIKKLTVWVDDPPLP